MQDREFGLIKNSSQLEYNYMRILQDTRPKTRDSYLKRFSQWTPDIKNFNDFKARLHDINSKWLSGQYRHATVRQYKATAVYAISAIYDFKNNQGLPADDSTPSVLKDMASKLNNEHLKALYLIANTLGSDGDRKEIDHKAHLEGNTSSIKDKRFDPSIMQCVFDYCKDNERYELLKMFLVVNSKLGLRPIEYKDVTLMKLDFFESSDDIKERFGINRTTRINDLNITAPVADEERKSECDNLMLIVKNAKNSHGRACGDYRFLNLGVLNEQEGVLLIKMLKTFREQVNKGLDFDKDVVRPLQNQLKYILTNDENCKAAIDRLYKKRLADYQHDIKNNPNRKEPLKKRPTLYSTRHQAVSNAKKEGLHPVVIAAAFGHASILTAAEHYGKRWHGTSGGVTPHQESINAVVERLTENQKAQLISQSVTEQSQVKTIQGFGTKKSAVRSRPTR